MALAWPKLKLVQIGSYYLPSLYFPPFLEPCYLSFKTTFFSIFNQVRYNLLTQLESNKPELFSAYKRQQRLLETAKWRRLPKLEPWFHLNPLDIASKSIEMVLKQMESTWIYLVLTWKCQHQICWIKLNQRWIRSASKSAKLTEIALNPLDLTGKRQ